MTTLLERYGEKQFTRTTERLRREVSQGLPTDMVVGATVHSFEGIVDDLLSFPADELRHDAPRIREAISRLQHRFPEVLP